MQVGRFETVDTWIELVTCKNWGLTKVLQNQKPKKRWRWERNWESLGLHGATLGILIMEFCAKFDRNWVSTSTPFVIICPFAACVQRCDIFFSLFFFPHFCCFSLRWQVCHILWSEQRIRGRWYSFWLTNGTILKIHQTANTFVKQSVSSMLHIRNIFLPTFLLEKYPPRN